MTKSNISNKILEQLKSCVGRNNFIDDVNDMNAYLSDWRNQFRGLSPLILKPIDTEMVSKILMICNENNVAVVPQGGNTGLVGGSIPSNLGNEIIVSMEKMNKIIHTDPINYTMTLEAGCILSNVQNAALNENRFFPLSLAAEGSCQIGGNLATNAGGTGVLRYGNAKELVLGLEVVLADGSIINTLKHLRKDNTGYDIKQLFLGSEGTLGIITKAVIKLFPIPRNKVTSIVAIPNIESTVNLLASFREKTGDSISAFEYIDRNCIDLLLNKLQIKDIFNIAFEHYALIELSSCHQNENLNKLLESSISSSIEDGSVMDAIVASNETQAAQFWNLRESLPGLLKNNGDFITFDLSVSISMLPALIKKTAKAGNSLCKNSKAYIFGHVGDGNIHYYLFKPKELTSNDFLKLKSGIMKSFYDITFELKGSFSAEHGIGLLKKEELKEYSCSEEMALMKIIKRNLDPNNIMNSGKVF
jgi:FAD/FMN-containing dehydrogenase